MGEGGFSGSCLGEGAEEVVTRILLISQNFPPEQFGNASRVYDLSKHLVELGCKVMVMAPHPTFPFGSFPRVKRWKEETSIAGIRLLRMRTVQPQSNTPSFSMRMGYYLSFPLHAVLWALWMRREYEVVVTTNPPIFTGITGLLVKKLTGKPWVLDIRDLWIDASISLGFIQKGSMFERVSRWYERLCFTGCDSITVTTSEIQRLLEERYPVAKGKILVMPNGVDMAVFQPAQAKKPRIIYSGLLGTAQDLEVVIRAFARVRQKHQVMLYLVGDGELRRGLEDLAREEGVQDAVVFTGLLDREQVPGLIAGSLVGLAPLKDEQSLRYAIPTKALEYMACGIPFIAMGHGEIERLAERSKAGLVAENTVASLSGLLNRVLADETMRAEMGRKGRRFVEGSYDRRKIAERFLTAVQQMMT